MILEFDPVGQLQKWGGVCGLSVQRLSLPAGACKPDCYVEIQCDGNMGRMRPDLLTGIEYPCAVYAINPGAILDER